MERRPRQTTKGTTVENRMGAARTTPLCLWSIREKGQKPCWNLALQCPRPGTPGLGSTTRIRTRGISPRVCLRSLAEERENPLKLRPKKGKNRRFQPVGSLVGHLWVCICPRLFGAVVSPCGSTRPRESVQKRDPTQ